MPKSLNTFTKELHACVSKLNKALDKALDPAPDVCKPLKGHRLQQQTLHQARYDMQKLFVCPRGTIF